MTKISRERERVLEVLYEALLISNDYELDDLAREILSLPPRPKNSLPFVGWLLPEKKQDKKLYLSEKGLTLIKRWEGLRQHSYLCPGNVWTIGYGHTRGVNANQFVTTFQAETLLLEDIKVFEDSVNDLVKVPLTQFQFDALVSFTFNVGIYAFKKSTLLRKLNSKDYEGASKELFRWVNANGKKLEGLVSRRQDEYNLFNNIS